MLYFKHTSDRNLDNHTLCCIFKHTSDRNLGNHCVLISSFQQALGLGDNLPNSKNTSLKTTYIRPLIQILLFQIRKNAHPQIPHTHFQIKEKTPQSRSVGQQRACEKKIFLWKNQTLGPGCRYGGHLSSSIWPVFKSFSFHFTNASLFVMF